MPFTRPIPPAALGVQDTILVAARNAASVGSLACADERWQHARYHFQMAYELLALIDEQSDDIVDLFAQDMPFEQW